MIIRITAKDVPRDTVKQLLNAARQRVAQQTLTPILTSEHKGSYYVVVDHPDVAELFSGGLSGMNVQYETVDEFPGELRRAPVDLTVVVVETFLRS